MSTVATPTLLTFLDHHQRLNCCQTIIGTLEQLQHCIWKVQFEAGFLFVLFVLHDVVSLLLQSVTLSVLNAVHSVFRDVSTGGATVGVSSSALVYSHLALTIALVLVLPAQC